MWKLKCALRVRKSPTPVHGDNSREKKAIFRRTESETTVRQNIGRTVWCLTTEVMVKILRQCFLRRRCASEDLVRLREGRKDQLARDDGGVVRRFKRIQSETTVREKLEYGKNILMVGDGGDARGRSRRFERVEDDDLREIMARIQENA
jgi:hypothetical protein